MSKLGLYARLPVAKKVWRMNCVEKDIDIETVLELATENLPNYIDILIEWRMDHPRAFKRLPRYLKFFIMRVGNPRVMKNSKVGEFDIFLDNSEPPRIVVPWF